MTGKEQRVLIEKVGEKGLAQGYGEHYLPVKFQAPDSSRNVFRKVRLEKVEAAENPFIYAKDQSFRP
jgi:threonylcarbamoyladenosine tRNA methylthiotransferase MtaB